MRIISGKLRGLTIKTIDSDSTRPTRDMVREALFSILMYQVPDCTFLDLFAGSGAIGLEAISRGAKSCIFVDKNPQCIKTIHENVRKARVEQLVEIYNTDYQKALHHLSKESIDVIYVDPPYHQEMGISAINIISEKNLLKEDGVIILETDTNEIVPEEIGRYERYNYKRYGRNVLSLYRRKE